VSGREHDDPCRHTGREGEHCPCEDEIGEDAVSDDAGRGFTAQARICPVCHDDHSEPYWLAEHDREVAAKALREAGLLTETTTEWGIKALFDRGTILPKPAEHALDAVQRFPRDWALVRREVTDWTQVHP
jgi:hypothetical protein